MKTNNQHYTVLLGKLEKFRFFIFGCNIWDINYFIKPFGGLFESVYSSLYNVYTTL